MPIYKNDRNVITPLFDQIRRITETEDAMTFESAIESLLNVTPLSEFPKAENAGFGLSTADTETGITTLGSESQNVMRKAYTVGWRFTASEAFSIIGLRHKQNHDYFKYLSLWDVDGNRVAYFNVTSDMATDWISYYLDNPITVAVGETYTVAMYTQNYNYASTSTTVFSSKLCDVTPVISAYDMHEFPTNTASSIFCLDIIMAPIQAPLPDDYQISRTTMDDIAEEVQRITGTESKMTTAQIVTALRGIATPTTE